MSQDQDLIDKYLADTPEMRDLLCYPDRDKLRSILTRFLAEVRGVDVEKVWNDLPNTGGYEPGSSLNQCKLITTEQLAAALDGVKGERG